MRAAHGHAKASAMRSDGTPAEAKATPAAAARASQRNCPPRDVLDRLGDN
jgi:hypothetical protein